METKEIDLLALLKSLWTEKRKIIKWGLIGAAAGLVIAFSIPKQYETVVKVVPEGRSMGANGSMGNLAAIAGLDIGGAASDGISEKIYPQIIKSTPFMMEFADIEVYKSGEKMNFFTYVTKEQSRAWWSYIFGFPVMVIDWAKAMGSESQSSEAKSRDMFRPSSAEKSYIAKLGSMIFTDIDKKNGILTVTTTMQDPVISAVIADSLLSKLQRYMTLYRTSKARADLLTKEKMLEEARLRYYEADSQFAMAQDRNLNLATKSAQVKLDRLSNEKMLAFSVYQQLATQVELSKVKLQEDTPITTVIEPPSVAVQASSPKKILTLVAFTFLGILAACGVVMWRYATKKAKE